MAHRSSLWGDLLSRDADVALLQEACEPPTEIKPFLDLDNEPWRTAGTKKRHWRTAIVGINKNVNLDRITTNSIPEARDGDFGVSQLGTLAAAHVEDPNTGEVFTVVSMYALWEKPHSSTGSGWIFADASVHRLISDISVLVGQEKGHRIIASGDLNSLYGYGEFGNKYWGGRYRTIFDRFTSIGLKFVGPQYPNGRQANPWPSELPNESLNVPTYHTNRQTPATATRQLDFVFASSDIADRIQVKALNSVEDWGGSDHCKIQIDVL